jgi:hypothetical protein
MLLVWDLQEVERMRTKDYSLLNLHVSVVSNEFGVSKQEDLNR